MNDKIKEILEYLKNNTFIPDETKRKYKILHRDEVKRLLDYITNLQQIEQEHQRINGELREEINKLTAESTEWESKYYEMQDNFHNANEEIERQSKAQVILDDMLANYKHQIDKVIEYIDKQKKKMYKSRNKIAMFILMKLENILQNGSEKE